VPGAFLGNGMFEDLWHKIGGIVAAMVSAISGLYLYDRNTVNTRLIKLEDISNQFKVDLRVGETQFSALKEDVEEIKESQKIIIKLLSNGR
jgi:hypothetical protein